MTLASTVVTALGAVTPVGLDATTTCASIRAGLARPAPIDEFQVLDRDEQEPIALTGHPVALLTRGFVGVGRWLQLLAPAVLDLCRDLPGSDVPRFWAATTCTLVAPLLDPGRFEEDPACESEQALMTSLVAPLLARVAGRFAPARVVVRGAGRCGALEAIARADEELAAGRCERVVVLAVDALTDAPSLRWLAGHGRLKEDENPVGLMPGEAAVGLLCESPAGARRRRAAPLARVAAVATLGEAPDVERGPGEALADVITRALADARVPPAHPPDVILDLNGEHWRAEEYGHARARVPPALWGGGRVHLPAASVGDVGAAMSALQIALACRALARGYAGAPHVLCAASDEYGPVGAAVLQREG